MTAVPPEAVAIGASAGALEALDPLAHRRRRQADTTAEL